MTLADRIDPARAAVIVIDVQNDFCHPQGFHGGLGKDLSIVSRAVARLGQFLPAAREAGVPVVFVRNGHSPASDTAEWRARHLAPRPTETCRIGTWGADFYGVSPTDADIVVDKDRYNAFTRTDLDATLKDLGRRSLMFCGVTSNTCVETTLRDAVCRDYLATMVEDCCGAFSVEAHRRAVESIRAGFGLVTTSADIVRGWEAMGGQPTTAAHPVPLARGTDSSTTSP